MVIKSKNIKQSPLESITAEEFVKYFGEQVYKFYSNNFHSRLRAIKIWAIDHGLRLNNPEKAADLIFSQPF